MATETELNTRLATLETHQASGVLRVTMNGETVEYRSMADLTQAIVTVRRQLSALGTTNRTRVVNPYASKGL